MPLPILCVTSLELTESSRKVEAMGPAEVERLWDDLYACQPVLLHALVCFRFIYPDPEIAGRLMLNGSVLWHAFRRFSALRQTRIDDELFDRLSDRNFAFLKYLDGETDKAEIARLTGTDLDRYRQMPAFGYLHEEITYNRSGVYTMPFHERGKALLTMKGVLDSMDEVLNGPESDPQR